MVNVKLIARNDTRSIRYYYANNNRCKLHGGMTHRKGTLYRLMEGRR